MKPISLKLFGCIFVIFFIMLTFQPMVYAEEDDIEGDDPVQTILEEIKRLIGEGDEQTILQIIKLVKLIYDYFNETDSNKANEILGKIKTILDTIKSLDKIYDAFRDMISCDDPAKFIDYLISLLEGIMVHLPGPMSWYIQWIINNLRIIKNNISEIDSGIKDRIKEIEKILPMPADPDDGEDEDDGPSTEPETPSNPGTSPCPPVPMPGADGKMPPDWPPKFTPPPNLDPGYTPQ